MTSSRTIYDCFAVTAPGLEPLGARELRALHALGVRRVRPEPGGVAFSADAAALLAANLRLRTVSRLIVRLAEFPARAFHELERRSRQVPWERVVAPGRTARVRVTCRKSRLYHSDAVAERVLAAIERRVPGALIAPGSAVRATVEDEDDGDDGDDGGAEGEGEQLVVVRVLHDRVTVSADSSGALLHRRGYRQAVAKAPLRETLAAAMLMGAGWDPESPLLDPMCGSGTIAIEAALLARSIAPGLGRSFAMEEWPEADDALRGERARAAEEALPAARAPIVAADRDAGAVQAALANAERAGVAADVTVIQRPLSATEAIPGPGWLVTNPPYGARIGEGGRLRDLYARLGQVARTALPGWTVALLAADPRLEGQVGLPLEERFRTRNGGLPVRLVTARVPTRL